ncbi:MAG: CHASE2 domain-containing protein [Cyanobacteriota bacterium]|nr:CHASE2 domain-containing protein [Cyanobacteriota bacterium]
MAGKLVILKLDGNLQGNGFRVTLEVGDEGKRPQKDCVGDLPADPDLADAIARYWKEDYRSLEETNSRAIRPGKMVYTGSIGERVEQCKRSAKLLSDRVNDWLKSLEFQTVLNCLQQNTNLDDEIRFLIRTEDETLHKLPWDEWNILDAYPKAGYSCCSLQSSAPPSFQRSTKKRKVKILAILGCQDGINAAADLKTLESLSDIVEITALSEPGSEQINHELWEQYWDIIFFAGHSKTEGEAGVIYINPSEALPIQPDSVLWYGLREAVKRGLKLVIFNSCDGLGLAKQLDDLHIPQVIFMRELVADFAAQKFLKDFLRAYIRGSSLHLAVREAKEKLRGLKVDVSGMGEKIEIPYADWLPVIWQNPAARPLKWEELLPLKTGRSRTRTARSRQPWQRSLARVAIAGLAIATLVYWGRWEGKLQPLELKAYDFLMQQRPLQPRDERIVIVRITPEDRERLQQPPEETGEGARTLSDRNLNRLFEKLERLQPAVIGFLIAREGSVSSQYPHLKAGLESDRAIALCQTQSPDLASIQRNVSAPDEVTSERIGFYTFLHDGDGIVRRHLLYRTVDNRFPCKGDRVLEFGFRVAQTYLQQKGYSYQDRPEQSYIQLGDVKFKPLKLHRGGYHRPDSDVEGGIQVMLNYRPYRDYQTDIARTVSLSEFFDDRLTLDDVKNKIILIGRDFSDDRQKTPYHRLTQNSIQKVPGLFMVAQQASQILSHVEQTKPLIWTWYWWGDALWILGWSWVGGALVWYNCFFKEASRKTLLIWGLSFGAALATLYGLCWVVFFKGGWIPLIPAALGLLGTGGTIVIYQNLKNIIPIPPNPP